MTVYELIEDVQLLEKIRQTNIRNCDLKEMTLTEIKEFGKLLRAGIFEREPDIADPHFDLTDIELFVLVFFDKLNAI